MPAMGHKCKARLASPQPASRTPPGAVADAAPRRGPALMLGVGDVARAAQMSILSRPSCSAEAYAPDLQQKVRVREGDAFLCMQSHHTSVHSATTLPGCGKCNGAPLR